MAARDLGGERIVGVGGVKLRRLLIERSGGITLSICRAVERAGIAAIRSGRERIELSGLDDPEIWRGLSPPEGVGRLRPAALVHGQP